MNIKNRNQHGFTLIEVLVAVLVLSVGLLGLAGLQVYSMRFNQSANYRTQATILASQFLDMAKSYRGASEVGADPRSHANIRRLAAGLESFSNGGALSDVTRDCYGTSPDPLRCDRARWFAALGSQIPGGLARVTFEGMPTGIITVEICWADDRTEIADDGMSSDCTGAGEGYGTPTIGPNGSDSWGNNALWLRTRI